MTNTLECAFCGREYEFEHMCDSDDCPIREAEINIEKVGYVSLDYCGGRDEMVALTRDDDDLTPEQAEQWLLPKVYRDTNTPGGYFCHSLTAMQHPFAKNRCFVLIHHRLDV